MWNRAKEREFRYGYLPSYDEGLKILEGVKDPDVRVATKAAVKFMIYMDRQGWLWRHLIPCFHTHKDYTLFKKLVLELFNTHYRAVGHGIDYENDEIPENQDPIRVQALRELALEDAERILSDALPDTLGIVGMLKSLYSPAQLKEIVAGLSGEAL